MTKRRSAAAALTAVLCAATMTGAAEARGFHGGHFGGHFGGHYGHFGHVGHGWGHGHWGHGGWRGPVVGFGLYAPYYSAYAYDDDEADCYRVYRYHRWRIVCD